MTGWEAPDMTNLTIGTPGYVDQPLFPDPRSAGARLTARQHAMIRGNPPVHPVAGGPLHTQAPTDTSPSDRFPRPFTCGTCELRFRLTYPSRPGAVGAPKVEWKCGAEDGARITHGAATTVPGWWPACPDYTPVP